LDSIPLSKNNNYRPASKL